MYFAGLTIINVTAGSLNMGRGDDSTKNVSPVKQIRVGGNVYPYVSAQAYRRWLRDTMAETFDASPVEFVQSGNQQAYTAGRPDKYADDDLFGYMRAIKKQETQRQTVLASGMFVSAQAYNRIPTDFGTLTRGLSARDVEGAETNGDGSNAPLLHEHEHYSGDLVGPWLLDAGMVGRVFTADSGSPRRHMLPDEIKEAVEESGLSPCKDEVHGYEALELPLEERRTRVATLLRAMAGISGGANQASNYNDVTPSLVLVAPMKSAVNPFTQIVSAEWASGTHVDVDVLLAELDAWDDQLVSTPMLGWRPGWLKDQRDKAVASLGDRVTIGHPRTVLKTLAEQVEAGDHDPMFA